MKIKTDLRGFPLTEFADYYRNRCSLQISSIADIECVWLGVDDVQPKIMAKNALKYGVLTTETTGWVDYKLPRDVIISTRMHLTRDQVAELIPHLQNFVDTGEL